MYPKTIYIGSDHGGLEGKAHLAKALSNAGYDIKDSGPFILDPDDDYPDFAVKVCRRVLADKSRGILICRSGAGMCMVANKIPGIYAAVCWDEESAFFARQDEDINVLCMGTRSMSMGMLEKVAKKWLETPFAGGRHIRRVKKIKALEKSLKKVGK